jgi:hypothetical protein
VVHVPPLGQGSRIKRPDNHVARTLSCMRVDGVVRRLQILGERIDRRLGSMQHCLKAAHAGAIFA